MNSNSVTKSFTLTSVCLGLILLVLGALIGSNLTYRDPYTRNVFQISQKQISTINSSRNNDTKLEIIKTRIDISRQFRSVSDRIKAFKSFKNCNGSLYYVHVHKAFSIDL